jgi:hypothetical protein
VLKWRRTEILLIVLNLSLHFYNIYVHILLSAKTFFNTSYNVFNVRHHFDCQFWSLVCEPIFWFVNLFFGLLTYFLVCEPIFKESVITCTIPDKTKITKIEYRYRYYLNSKRALDCFMIASWTVWREDTKGVIRSRKSKDKPYNGHQEKKNKQRSLKHYTEN